MWCLNLTTTLLSSSCTAIQSPPNGHLKQEVDDDDNHVEDTNNDHGLYSDDEIPLGTQLLVCSQCTTI